jgi:hypothetical protein
MFLLVLISHDQLTEKTTYYNQYCTHNVVSLKEVCTEINQSLDLTFSPLIIKETFEDTSKTIE